MSAVIASNPFQTTNAAGTFSFTTEGEVQGTFYDDPVARYALAGGWLSYSETLPMWGGVGVYAQIPTPGVANPSGDLGVVIGRATTLTQTSSTGLAGFSVFNQAHSMVIVPSLSTVPLVASGGLVNYFPLLSGACIAVACDPSLASLEGGAVGQQVSWDFNNQRLAPYETSATVSVTSMTWSSTNGGQLAIVTAAASPVGAVGDAVNISGATNTGTGGNSVVNGNFIVNTFTDNQHFTVSAAAASGVYGTIAGTIVLNYGTGALACRVLRIASGNSMTVSYNTATGAATWNYAGTTAVIQI